MSELKTMLQRHRDEVTALRATCKHEKLNMRSDRSQIGLGTCWPRIDIVCRNCGTKKIIFFRSEEEYKRRGDIIKTLEKQPGFADQRTTVIAYDYEIDGK